MKKTILFTVALFIGSLISISSCSIINSPSDGQGNHGGHQQGNSETIVEVNDKITYEILGKIDEEKGTSEGSTIGIRFSRFPASVKEFKQLRSEIGGTAQGIVALQMMAGEMAIHNKIVGRKCMELINVSSNMPQMEDLFLNRLDREEGQGISPYHVAAFLQGTKWDEGYNTLPPYTILMKLSDSPYSGIYQANELEMRVLYNSGSSLTEARFHVIKTKKPDEKPCENGKYFMVISCGDFLSNASIRVKAYGTTYNGLVPFNK